MAINTICSTPLKLLFPGQADSDAAWEELKTLLRTRIDNALAGKISTQT
ncbi:MAG: hypothetical protein LBF16_10985 [Pseudomonadales bacterium]|nr:hypothetical protein [Pseudomonadales bacterium]